jgi:hypothetical protein
MRHFLLVLWLSSASSGLDGKDVQARMGADAAANRPLTAHVIVCLADNRHQGIVPVATKLGNGQDPENNLYWGAMYGVKTYLLKAGWKRVADKTPLEKGMLDRIILHKRIQRGEREVDVRIVAEAWDGREIRKATVRFLRMSAGREGTAHVAAYVGHDGLMDFELKETPRAKKDAPPRSAAVFACASREYFQDILKGGGAHALVLTTGLMCPEAYTLDAMLQAWFSGADAKATREAVARAYQKYQKCSQKAARGLFSGDD